MRAKREQSSAHGQGSLFSQCTSYKKETCEQSEYNKAAQGRLLEPKKKTRRSPYYSADVKKIKRTYDFVKQNPDVSSILARRNINLEKTIETGDSRSPIRSKERSRITTPKAPETSLYASKGSIILDLLCKGGKILSQRQSGVETKPNSTVRASQIVSLKVVKLEETPEAHEQMRSYEKGSNSKQDSSRKVNLHCQTFL